MADNEFDWYGPETSTFGDRVCAAREQAGMSQKQLAKRLGVKHSTIISWEQDYQNRVQIDFLCCQAF